MTFLRPPTHTLWRHADGSGGMAMAVRLGCALLFVKKNWGPASSARFSFPQMRVFARVLMKDNSTRVN